MTTYRVAYAIDLDADTPQAAAELAWAIATAPDSQLPILTVTDALGASFEFDLEPSE